MTHAKNVKRLYSIFSARWYDYFSYFWTKSVSNKAEQEFMDLLKKYIKPESKILDLGCGTGINIERIKQLNIKFKEYAGVDFSDDMIRIAMRKYGNIKHAHFMKRDITKKPDNKKYDLIISTWVLSHIPKPTEVVNRYYDKLNKGGVMLFVFLTRPKWFINFWFYPLLRLFAAEYVDNQDIKRINGKKTVKKYALGVMTLLEIRSRMSSSAQRGIE